MKECWYVMYMYFFVLCISTVQRLIAYQYIDMLYMAVLVVHLFAVSVFIYLSYKGKRYAKIVLSLYIMLTAIFSIYIRASSFSESPWLNIILLVIALYFIAGSIKMLHLAKIYSAKK